MKEFGAGTQLAAETAPVKVAPLDQIFDDMKQVFDSIKRRAYEIFENNGREFGRDMDNWLKAEKELLHPMHLHVSESDDMLTVRAEVPGFNAKELEISIEPRRLVIAGERASTKEEKKEKSVYSERCSSHLFLSVELPTEVDENKVTATLKDGVLDLKMPKATAAKKIQIASAA